MNKNFNQRLTAGRCMAGLALFAFAIQWPARAHAVPYAVEWQQQVQENLTVKGTVIDDSDGQPLPGVTVMDGNRKVLGTTNNNGGFTFKVPKGTTLSFTMIGYTTGSRMINGNQENLVMRLKESSSALDEVVVTALGIKREEKSLGYATTTVKGEALTEALSNNWTDALSGKVAGFKPCSLRWRTFRI